MKVGIIGAGKVGTSLGKLFSEGGVAVAGFYSRNVLSARESADFTKTKCFEAIEVLIENSDAVFITVPDGQITSVYKQICEYDIQGKYICHCSGAMSATEAFPDIEERGAYGFSVHPLFPVSSKFESYRELRDAFFCLEGSYAHILDIEHFFRDLGCRTQRIGAKDKAKYHLACVFASNLICALISDAEKLICESGFDENLSLEALRPLILNNVNNVLNRGVISALTGPVERCDINTIEKHMKCIDGDKLSLYKLLSLELAKISEIKNPNTNYEELKKLLGGDVK